MTNFNSITHVIYDMDGLLLDTEPVYTQVTQEFVGRFGKVFDWSVKSKMIGRPQLVSAKILVEDLQLPCTPEDYLEMRKKRLPELFSTVKALPGAEALVRHLHQAGVPQAVATSSHRDLFERKTKHHHWFSLFDTIVVGDDPAVKRGKPAPDIFLVAADLLKAEPQHCLVFEDAPSGQEAALAAGMSVVVVPDPNMEQSVYESAHQILNSLNDFQPKLWNLPHRD